MKKIIKPTIFISLMMLTMIGYSQKGVGESQGVSKQGIKPQIVTLKGTVEEILTEPCKYTTGKSISGTHLIIKTNQKQTLNIHLGPTTEVSGFVEDIDGNEIEIKAFRTDKLPSDHYIAKELMSKDETTVLRDETLKPFWAGKYGKERWGRRRN